MKTISIPAFGGPEQLTLMDMPKPVPVAVNFIACYVLMPGLALLIAKFLALSPALMAGLVLVGSITIEG